MQIEELTPRNGRKSFYGKAFVITKGKIRILRSFDTIVAYFDADGNFHRTWSGWSSTTGNHIQSFGGPCKAKWDKLPVERAPRCGIA